MTTDVPSTQPTVSKVMRPLGDVAGWMKLLGILAIVQGVLLALSIIGILIAWLPIWMGILLTRASNSASEAVATGDEDAAVTTNENLRTMFKVQGIIVAIFLVWGLIAALAAIFAIAGSSS